ncbi:MAG: acylphosphatase [Naasia sp.]|nr:acylphosphatase [Naasia sp.]
MPDTDRAHLALVSGHVQGVGFRWSAMRQAGRLGVTGWVRNRADGRVEAHVEGNADAVDAMLAWLHTGPSGARVDTVEVRDTDAEGGDAFALLH